MFNYGFFASFTFILRKFTAKLFFLSKPGEATKSQPFHQASHLMTLHGCFCEIKMGSSEFVLGEFSCPEMASAVVVVSRCPVIVDPNVMAKYDNPVGGQVKSSLSKMLVAAHLFLGDAALSQVATRCGCLDVSMQVMG